MLLTVALLSVYSAYAFLIGSIERSWMIAAGGIVAVAAAYGVAMLRPWSRYPVYLLTGGFVAKLGLSIYDGIASGYFGLQFATPGAAARSLVPSLLMVLLSGACCVFVFRHFRKAQGEPATG